MRSANANHSPIAAGSSISRHTASGCAATMRSRSTSIIALPPGRLVDSVRAMNRTDSERFEQAYRSLWGALHRSDDPELSQHERQLLHHVPAQGVGVSLIELARHLALPKSSASVLVKSLA